MCGIFGYLGEESVSVCLAGLKKLEYRGYDSSGIAGLQKNNLKAIKKTGKIQALESYLAKNRLALDCAIAHTRWATTGEVSETNAHPHVDEKETLALVHNGIIDNYHLIKSELEAKGYTFYSETDSEVIAALIADHYEGDMQKAMTDAFKKLKGSFAIALIHRDYPDHIFGCARECPLVVGYHKESQKGFFSSDPNTIDHQGTDIYYLLDHEIAILNRKGLKLFDATGIEKIPNWERLEFISDVMNKQGYEHFMLKEIHEQPKTLERTMYGRFSKEFGTALFKDLHLSKHELQSIRRVLILACGTSWHAGCIARSMLENMARIPTEVEIASEFRYTNPIIAEDTLVIAISQSGETADTMAAIREAKSKGAKVIGICNVKQSQLAREADSCLFLEAGPEISVCSTKAFTSQLTLLSLFTLLMARLHHYSKEEGQQFLQDLQDLPDIIQKVLYQSKEIETFAKKYCHFENFYFLGRRYMYPTSLEAALKLKEISYVNATGYPAGEMKHGPLALICPDYAVIGMCGNLQTLDKMMSNLLEVKARKGTLLIFAPEDHKEVLNISSDVIFLPKVRDELASIPYSVATQLFAYYIANYRGTDIDHPRNLAKSVTVE